MAIPFDRGQFVDAIRDSVERNELHEYSQYQPYFRFFMVPEALALRSTIPDESQWKVLAETGGAAETTIAIESATLRTSGALTRERGIGVFTGFNMRLTQPGQATFLDWIIRYAQDLGIRQPRRVPYFLELTFRVRDPDSQDPLHWSRVPHLRWVWATMLTRTEMKITSGGSEYDIDGSSWSSSAMTRENSVIRRPIRISGMQTVRELFDELANQLTERPGDDREADEQLYDFDHEYEFNFDDELADLPLRPSHVSMQRYVQTLSDVEDEEDEDGDATEFPTQDDVERDNPDFQLAIVGLESGQDVTFDEIDVSGLNLSRGELNQVEVLEAQIRRATEGDSSDVTRYASRPALENALASRNATLSSEAARSGLTDDQITRLERERVAIEAALEYQRAQAVVAQSAHERELFEFDRAIDILAQEGRDSDAGELAVRRGESVANFDDRVRRFFRPGDLPDSAFPSYFEEKRRRLAPRRQGSSQDQEECYEFTFQTGTSIEQIIIDVMLSLGKIQARIQGNPTSDSGDDSEQENEPGTCEDQEATRTKVMFRIVSEVDGLSFNEALLDYNRKFTYNVVRYENTGPIAAPTDIDIAPTSLSDYAGRLRRVYDYTFTGLNNDILDLDLTFRFNWYAALPVDGGLYRSSQTGHFGPSDEPENSELRETRPTSTIAETPLGGETVNYFRPHGAPVADTVNQSLNHDAFRNSNRTMASVLFEQYVSPANMDMANIELTIRGDPFWLEPDPMTSVSGPIPRFSDRSSSRVNDSTEHMTYFFLTAASGQPSDPDTGLGPASFANNTLWGVYGVTEVEHIFESRGFTQKLKAFRDMRFKADTAISYDEATNLLSGNTARGGSNGD